MPTSPAVLANNVTFKWASVDLSGDLNQVKLNFNQGEIDASVFTITGWKQFITSISDFTFDVTGFFDKTAGMDDATLFGQFGAPLVSSPFEFDIPNSSSGSVKYTGNAWAKTYAIDAKVNDAIRLTSSFRGTNAPIRATI